MCAGPSVGTDRWWVVESGATVHIESIPWWCNDGDNIGIPDCVGYRPSWRGAAGRSGDEPVDGRGGGECRKNISIGGGGGARDVRVRGGGGGEKEKKDVTEEHYENGRPRLMSVRAATTTTTTAIGSLASYFVPSSKPRVRARVAHSARG